MTLDVSKLSDGGGGDGGGLGGGELGEGGGGGGDGGGGDCGGGDGGGLGGGGLGEGTVVLIIKYKLCATDCCLRSPTFRDAPRTHATTAVDPHTSRVNYLVHLLVAAPSLGGPSLAELLAKERLIGLSWSVCRVRLE